MSSSCFSVLVVLVVPLLGCSAIGFAGLKDCAPVYGNWCGENYPHEGANPPAVDSWDAACRNHDKCYGKGISEELCDLEFVAELEKLSREQLAPRRMHNAHSWFRRDGFLGGSIKVEDEFWAAGASCKGGDGRAALFYCVTLMGGCPLNPHYGGGHEGLPCFCGPVRGQIVER